MKSRGELRPDADLDELSHALLAALQGGVTLSQATRSTQAMRAALNAALAYVQSFAAADSASNPSSAGSVRHRSSAAPGVPA